MDRTAWIVVTFCVIGLVSWTWWTGKQIPRRPVPVTATQTAPTPPPANSQAPLPSAAAAASAAPSATPVAQSSPTFAEKNETLRNEDIELHLTNRGGGIQDAVLINQLGQERDRVKLNSKEQIPIGAIMEKPDSPALDEFTLAADTDGGVRAERNSNGVVTRKKFFFPPGKEKKDNFL